MTMNSMLEDTNTMLTDFKINLRYTLPGRSNPDWNDLMEPINELVGKLDNVEVSYTTPDSEWFKELHVHFRGSFTNPTTPGSDQAKSIYTLLNDVYNVSAPFDINGWFYDKSQFNVDSDVKVYKLFKGNDQAVRGGWDYGFNRVHNPARVMSHAWIIQRDNKYVSNYS